MKDNEARGVVLQFLHERRREGGFYPESEVSPLFQESGRDEFYRICEQLAEFGLVDWEKLMVPSMAGGWKTRATSIMITAAGVNAVESRGETTVGFRWDRKERGGTQKHQPGLACARMRGEGVNLWFLASRTNAENIIQKQTQCTL